MNEREWYLSLSLSLSLPLGKEKEEKKSINQQRSSQKTLIFNIEDAYSTDSIFVFPKFLQFEF